MHSEDILCVPHQEAAILIQYARDGQEIDDSQNVSQYHVIFRVAAWLILLVHVFERPMWTFRIHDGQWRDGNIYPSFQMSFMPYSTSTILTGLLVGILWIAVGLEFGFKSNQRTNYMTLTFSVVLAIKTITIFVNVISLIVSNNPVMSTSPIEALCVLLVEFKYENNLGYLIRTLPKFVSMMVVVAVIICTYTSLGFIIFEPSSQEATQYFMFYGSAVWNMIMVLSGSNWPPPMMPAYEQNRAYVIYFIIYIITMNWGLLNVVLGFVYLFFKIEQEEISKRLEDIKNTHYTAAFKLLDSEEKGFLTYSQVDALLEELFVYYEETRRIPSAEERHELIVWLDSQSSGVINAVDFFAIEKKCLGNNLEVLRAKKNKLTRQQQRAHSQQQQGISLTVWNDRELNNCGGSSVDTDRNDTNANESSECTSAGVKSNYEVSSFEKFFSIYGASVAMKIDTVTFDITVDTVLFILGVMFVVEFHSTSVFHAYFIFAWCEVMAKLITKGRFRYVRSYRNSVDGILSLVLLLLVIERNTQYEHLSYFGDFGIKMVVLIRLFLFPRNIIATQYFKDFRSRHRIAFEFATRGVDHFSFLLLVMFVLVYGFAALGQQLFGGMIVKTGAHGDLIAGTTYGVSNYWPLNFNDMPSGFVTMFVLLHVNNMHVTTSGFVVIGGQWCELFFGVFYALGVLFMLNVLIAVFLNEFTSYLECLAAERIKLRDKEDQEKLQHRDNNIALKSSQPDLMNSVRIKFEAFVSFFSPKVGVNKTSSSGNETSERDGVELQNISGEIQSTGNNLMKDNHIQSGMGSGSPKELQREVDLDHLAPEEAICRENISFCEHTLTNEHVTANSDICVELEMNAEHNKRTTMIARHEINIMNHLTAHHIPVRKTKRSLLTWMYGANPLSPHQKAAVLVQFARDGEQHSILGSELSLLCYRYRSKCSTMLRFASFLYAFLKFFERPVWTFQHSNWHDNSAYPMSGLPQLSPSVLVGLKLPLLFVMLFGLALELGYKESDLKAMVSNLTPMRGCRYALTMLCIAQILILFYCLSIDTDKSHLVTATSHGSILYVLWFNRRSLSKFRIVFAIMPRLFVVLIAFVVTVLAFASFGLFIFRSEEVDTDDDADSAYFGAFSNSVWSVFVAITSSDYPNQVMPAYARSREMCIFFISFICIGTFGLMNVVVVVVLVEFQKALQSYTDHQKVSRQILLTRAFEILDVECRGFLEKQVVKLLLDELYLHYSDFQKGGIPKDSARNILLDILDIDGDGVISIDDFLFFLDVTRIKLSLDAKTTFMERYCPGVVNTHYFTVLSNVVKYYFFDCIVDIFVVVLIIMSLTVNHNNVYKSAEYSAFFIVLLLIIFIAEMVCKLVVKGYTNYFRSSCNKVDFCVTVSMLVLVGFGSIFANTQDVKAGAESGFTVFIHLLQMVRIVSFPRNLRYLMSSSDVSRFTRLMRRVFTKLYILGIVFLCIGYVFASLGMLCFGGLINRSPDNNPHYEELMASAFGQSGFWALNFNDFMSSCITLFSCLHVSDFDVIATGFTSTTSDWSRIYFTAWYVIGVLLMLNIVKSFFLEEFLSVFDNSDNIPSKTEDQMRHVRDNISGRADQNVELDSTMQTVNPLVVNLDQSTTHVSSSSTSVASELINASPSPGVPPLGETRNNVDQSEQHGGGSFVSNLFSFAWSGLITMISPAKNNKRDGEIIDEQRPSSLFPPSLNEINDASCVIIIDCGDEGFNLSDHVSSELYSVNIAGVKDVDVTGREALNNRLRQLTVVGSFRNVSSATNK